MLKAVPGFRCLLHRDAIFILLYGLRIRVVISNKFSGRLVHPYGTHIFNTADSEAVFIGQGPVPGPCC